MNLSLLFSVEYFSSLQQLNKWRTENVQTAVEDIVIIKEDNTPPMCWPLARIIQTFDGNDNIVRLVQIKTQTGVYIRPVSRLIPLHQKAQEDRGADWLIQFREKPKDSQLV